MSTYVYHSSDSLPRVMWILLPLTCEIYPPATSRTRPQLAKSNTKDPRHPSCVTIYLDYVLLVVYRLLFLIDISSRARNVRFMRPGTRQETHKTHIPSLVRNSYRRYIIHSSAQQKPLIIPPSEWVWFPSDPSWLLCVHNLWTLDVCGWRDRYQSHREIPSTPWWKPFSGIYPLRGKNCSTFCEETGVHVSWAEIVVRLILLGADQPRFSRYQDGAQNPSSMLPSCYHPHRLPSSPSVVTILNVGPPQIGPSFWITISGHLTNYLVRPTSHPHRKSPQADTVPHNLVIDQVSTSEGWVVVLSLRSPDSKNVLRCAEQVQFDLAFPDASQLICGYSDWLVNFGIVNFLWEQ